MRRTREGKEIPKETPSERRRRERGGIVVQAASGPNRRARRAAQAKGATRPTLDVNCNVCRVVFIRLPQPRTEAERVAGNEQVARAFRQHVRVSGCVRLEDVAPVSLPPVGGSRRSGPRAAVVREECRGTQAGRPVKSRGRRAQSVGGGAGAGGRGDAPVASMSSAMAKAVRSQ